MMMAYPKDKELLWFREKENLLKDFPKIDLEILEKSNEELL